MTFEYICFSISNICNLKCPYCFRYSSNSTFIELNNFKECIAKLVKLGCKRINITGGEPLLNPIWKDYVKICKQYGLEIILSSNGILLDMNDEILNDLFVLTVPLDGYNSSINAYTRGKGHFDFVYDIINKYKNGKYPFKLKINSVITKYNYETLENMGSILNHKNIIWKLFQYRSKGLYNNLCADLTVSNDAIKEKLYQIMQLKLSCWVMEEDIINDLNNPNEYLSVNCDGTLMICTQKGDINVCNILQTSTEAMCDKLRLIRPIIKPYRSLIGD